VTSIEFKIDMDVANTSHIDHAFNSTITESSPTLHSSWASYKKTPEFLQKIRRLGRQSKRHRKKACLNRQASKLPQDSPPSRDWCNAPFGSASDTCEGLLYHNTHILQCSHHPPPGHPLKRPTSTNRNRAARLRAQAQPSAES